MCGVWPGIIISSGPKTARQSVEHLIFSTENNQNILREDCSSQVLPFIQQCWNFDAMPINTGIYPSHQCFQWGECSLSGQSSLRSYGCSIQSYGRVSRSANRMLSECWGTQRRTGPEKNVMEVRLHMPISQQNMINLNLDEKQRSDTWPKTLAPRR